MNLQSIAVRIKIGENWTKPSEPYTRPKQLHLDVGRNIDLFPEFWDEDSQSMRRRVFHITKPQRIFFCAAPRTLVDNRDHETRGDGLLDWNLFQRDTPTLALIQINWPNTTDWMNLDLPIHHGFGGWRYDFDKLRTGNAVIDKWVTSDEAYLAVRRERAAHE